MAINDPKLMRFVVRPNCGGGIVGINRELFEPGMVYEVTELFGDYVIRKLGPSPLGMDDGDAAKIRRGLCNGRSYDCLYREFGGNLVRTVAELTADTAHGFVSITDRRIAASRARVAALNLRELAMAIDAFAEIGSRSPAPLMSEHNAAKADFDAKCNEAVDSLNRLAAACHEDLTVDEAKRPRNLAWRHMTFVRHDATADEAKRWADEWDRFAAEMSS